MFYEVLKFKKLDWTVFDLDSTNLGRIDYAKQKLSRETIINYQNEIGKSMSPLFGPKETFSVPGFAGKYKQNTELTIQQTNRPNKTILSIIREDGLHISSYSINDRALLQLTGPRFERSIAIQPSVRRVFSRIC